MGNANSGRKKNERPIRCVLTAILDEMDATTERKRLWNVCYKLVEKAEEGDLQAIRDMMDRLEGKVSQGIHGGGESGEHELVIRWKS